jgi:hypothetical protein
MPFLTPSEPTAILGGPTGKLLERGATQQQLEAYAGIRLVELDPDPTPTLRVTPSNEFVDRDKDGASGHAIVPTYVDLHRPSLLPGENRDRLLPLVQQHYKTDILSLLCVCLTGELKQARFVYVDEYTCIGTGHPPTYPPIVYIYV